MTLEEIAQLRLEADALTNQVETHLIDILKQLREGVPLSVGRTIVQDIWGEGLQASKLISKLSSSFPMENGYTIMHEYLPDTYVSKMCSFNEKTAVFFKGAFNWIEATITQIVAKLSELPTDDPMGQQLATTFRQESLRFIEALRYGDYRRDLILEDFSSWKDLKLQFESTGVTDGDYLFINDFVPEIEKLGEEMIRLRLNIRQEGDPNPTAYTSLSYVSYDSTRELCSIKITYVFCEYLQELLDVL